MSPRMIRCEDCGKLFSPVPGNTLCDACVRARLPLEDRVREVAIDHGIDTPEEIALAMGIPVDDVIAALKRIELPRKEIAADAICARCKKVEATSGSPFCIECRTELDEEFGKAARKLEEKIALMERDQPKKVSGSRMSARKTLEQKRLRATDQGRPRR